MNTRVIENLYGLFILPKKIYNETTIKRMNKSENILQFSLRYSALGEVKFSANHVSIYYTK